MTFNIFIYALLFSLMSFGPKRDIQTDFEKLYVLEGTWIMPTANGAKIGESWIKIDDSYLQNKGFIIKGSDTTITERVALRKSGSNISFTSTVVNQNNHKSINFNLTSSTGNEFVFENPDHDFPKRIVYKIVSADSIHAWIDGGKDDLGKRQDFYYSKVN